MKLKSNSGLLLAVMLAVIVLLVVSLLDIGATGTQNAGWAELGQGSASGGGISDNAGESGWPSIAISGDNPYVAWYDDSSGDEEIYVRRWNGTAWPEVGPNSATDGGISRNSGISTAPSIASRPSGNPCVAWRDHSSGYFEVYVRCWNGSTWSELGSNSATGGGVSNQQGSLPMSPSLAFAPDGTLYVAWDNNVGSSSEIYVARWNGSVWQRLPSGGSVSRSTGDSRLPSLVVAPNGTPYVAWQDESGADAEIYLRRWNGSSWEEVGAGSASGGGISGNSGDSARASLAFSDGGTPYLAWQDDTSGNWEVYMRRWNGSVWVEAGAGAATGGGISGNTTPSLRPRVAINESDDPCVAWQDRPQQTNEVYLRCWSGSAWIEVDLGSATGPGVSANNGHSSAPALAIGSNNRGYITWGDNSSGNYEIYVRSRLLTIESSPTPTASASATPTATASATAVATATAPAPPAVTATPRALNFIPMVAKLFTGPVLFPERVRFLPVVLGGSPPPTPTSMPPVPPTETPPSYPYPYP